MYQAMFKFVQAYLEGRDAELSKVGKFPFRKRSDHIRRVFMWAERLLADEPSLNREAVLTAAIFHDVGYAVSENDSNHAEHSAVICRKYLQENGYEDTFTDFTVYLVRNHSNKGQIADKDTPLELVILMEADLLDETGALSVVWDCMMEGAQEVQSFQKAYDHIARYTHSSLLDNKVVTEKAKDFWDRKQKLVGEFLRQLSSDMGLEHELF